MHCSEVSLLKQFMSVNGLSNVRSTRCLLTLLWAVGLALPTDKTCMLAEGMTLAMRQAQQAALQLVLTCANLTTSRNANKAGRCG